MDFRILGLDPAPFAPFYGAPDDELRSHNILRLRVDSPVGYPDRIELRDAAVGEHVLLLNHLYLDVASPYRGRHAIFVREGAMQRRDLINQVPPALATRLLSLRAFDRSGMMVDADVIAGQALPKLIEQFLSNPDVDFLHAHHAKRGCYAARIERA
ncbi:MAG: DUF1203 domain-containing protein [Rhodanobacteraceae bacterium]|nr:DUF1203 domain-containing protein [Xanthomonadales bacterium]MCP5473619.1 DUF1203 domain-containing protein [Rhodanobacteraceae bacterium]